MSIAGDMTLINAYTDDPSYFKGYTRGLRRAYELTHDEQVLSIVEEYERLIAVMEDIPEWEEME